METIEIDLKVGKEIIRTKELSIQQFENLVYYLDYIGDMYYNVDVLKNLKNNLELNKDQYEYVIEELEKVIDNIKEGDKTIYRSDYLSLLMLLSNIKFYEKENSKDVTNNNIDNN